MLTVSDNVCNSALWKTYRNKVMSMSDNIDVWYMSPATKLFQDPVSRAVIGVEIDKAGDTVNGAIRPPKEARSISRWSA